MHCSKNFNPLRSLLMCFYTINAFRISLAESVWHPVPCSGCHSEGFHGLRYKSDSASYHLCQMCFWRGNMDEKHRDDVFKEYSQWKVPGKPSGLRRSMRCVAPPSSASQQKRLPRFPDKPEQPLDLGNIVPASPLPTHNGFSQSEPSSRHMSPAISNYDRMMMSRQSGNHGRQFATLPQPGYMSGNQQQGSVAPKILHRFGGGLYYRRIYYRSGTCINHPLH